MTQHDIAEALRNKGFLVSGSSFRRRGAHESSDRVYLLCVGTATSSRIAELHEVEPGNWHISLVTPDVGKSLAELSEASFQTGRAISVEHFLGMDASTIGKYLGHDTHQNIRLAQL